MTFTMEEKRQLIEIARRSIREGLGTRQRWTPDEQSLPASLRRKGASFVTLHQTGELRGCIGSLHAETALAEDVAENAFRSAFQDPRFPPVSPADFDALEIAISVLTPFQPLSIHSEQELLQKLRPGVDGLYLDCDDGRAIFLPDVWKTLPEPARFVAALKRKAGLPETYPAAKIRWSIYHTEKV